MSDSTRLSAHPPLCPHPLENHLPAGKAFFSVKEHCGIFGISRSKFYLDLTNGLGPKITKLGRNTFISRQAELAHLEKILEGEAEFEDVKGKLRRGARTGRAHETTRSRV